MVAFETLTGRPPFVRREPSAVLLAHVRDPVPDASAIVPSLPPAVDEALARGLAKDPQERPESAGELIGDLRAALGTRALRPAALGVGAAGAVADPWDAAMVHFGEGDAAAAASRGNGGSGGGFVPVPERLTQAFGDAARRRGIAMKRDVAIAAGIAAAVLLITVGVGGWILGSSSADASGAKAEGYAAGVSAGKAAGTTAGVREGRIAGKKEGLAQGRQTGFAAGKKAGVAEGRTAGISFGHRHRPVDGAQRPRSRLVRGPGRLRRQRAGGLQLSAGRHGRPHVLRGQRRHRPQRALLAELPELPPGAQVAGDGGAHRRGDRIDPAQEGVVHARRAGLQQHAGARLGPVVAVVAHHPHVAVARLDAGEGAARAVGAGVDGAEGGARRSARSSELRSTARETVVAGRWGALSEYGTGLAVPKPSPWYQFSPAPLIAWPIDAWPPAASWWRLMKTAPRAPKGVTRPGVRRASTPAARRRVTTRADRRVVKPTSLPNGPEPAPVWAV